MAKKDTQDTQEQASASSNSYFKITPKKKTQTPHFHLLFNLPDARAHLQSLYESMCMFEFFCPLVSNEAAFLGLRG